MQENEAEISSAKQTPAKEAKNKELLVTRCAFAPYKLIKLQIANIKVTSLAQALNVVKNFLVSRTPTPRPGRRIIEGSLFDDLKLKKEEVIYRGFGL